MRLKDAKPPQGWYDKLVWKVGDFFTALSWKQPFKWLFARPPVTALLIVLVSVLTVLFIDLNGYDTRAFLKEWKEWEEVECAGTDYTESMNYRLQSYKVRGFVGDSVSYYYPPECL